MNEKVTTKPPFFLKSYVIPLIKDMAYIKDKDQETIFNIPTKDYSETKQADM